MRDVEAEMLVLLAAAIGDGAAGRGREHAFEEAEQAGVDREAARASLPADMGDHRRVFEAMGISFGEPLPGGGRADVHPDGDSLFVQVTLPRGWKKVRTDHPLNTNLVDASGRTRATIFYKPAFYDRRAFAAPTCRYGVSPANDDLDQYGVYDGDRQIWATDRLAKLPADATRAQRTAYYDAKDALRKQAATWLDEKYPNWRDPLAYWETASGEPPGEDAPR